MRSRLGFFLLLSFTLIGCGARKQVDVAPEDNQTRLPTTTQMDVKGWLEKPRSELAQLVEHHRDQVKTLHERLRQDPASATLLPQLRVPVRGVVFHSASFQSQRGFSLPAYVQGDKDAGVAAHLAAFGDVEAATKLGHTGTGPGRNYPVEWTEAVGSAFQVAELRLSMGEREAAGDLVLMHQALRELLDETAQKSPLGVALLNAGKRAATLAARAYRDPKVNCTAVAADLEEALKNWGTVTEARFPARSREQLTAVWGAAVSGQVATTSSEQLPRVLDLLGMAVPPEGVVAVGAFLDEKDQLAAVQLAYRTGLDTLYRQPADLVFHLEEQGLEAGNESKQGGTVRQMFSNKTLFADVVRLNTSPVLGAVATLSAVPNVTLPAIKGNHREFGVVHLDRLVDSCRVQLDPLLRGNPLTIGDAKVLARMTAAVTSPAPTAGLVEREGDLVSSVKWTWPSDLSNEQVGSLVVGLWKAYGLASFVEPSEKAPAPLTLSWNLGDTAVEFRVAGDDKGSVLSVADNQPKEKQAARLSAAQKRDASERAERLANGKADTRLSTGPGEINGYSLPNLKLGMSRREAEAALPAVKDFRKAKVNEGFSVLIDTPVGKNPFWAKQVLLRYTDDKVSEIRVRYLEREEKALRKKLSTEAKIGEGDTVQPDWLAVWADKPNAKVTKLRWQDDQTERTYQQDVGGSEVVWRSRLVPSTPWNFVTRGPGKAGLGNSREEFVDMYGAPPTTSDAATVFRMSDKTPYTMLLVWFEKDKAVRMVAVHREKPKSRKTPDINAALMKVWAGNLGGLGLIRREESGQGEVLGTLYWHDDQVRVQSSVVENDKGLQLLTEWRSVPFEADRTAVVTAP
jgi:hypothetical protein